MLNYTPSTSFQLLRAFPFMWSAEHAITRSCQDIVRAGVPSDWLFILKTPNKYPFVIKKVPAALRKVLQQSTAMKTCENAPSVIHADMDVDKMTWSWCSVTVANATATPLSTKLGCFSASAGSLQQDQQAGSAFHCNLQSAVVLMKAPSCQNVIMRASSHCVHNCKQTNAKMLVPTRVTRLTAGILQPCRINVTSRSRAPPITWMERP